VPRREDGDGLVAELEVAHAFARLLVARVEEHAEEIRGFPRGFPAFGDEADEQIVEHLHRPPVAEVLRRGDGEREIEEAPDALVGVDGEERERFADGIRLAREVAPEEGLAGDAHGERHHRAIDVHHAALARPALEEVRRGAGHHLDEALDALAMKGRGRDAPLALPEIAVRGDQPLAEKEVHLGRRSGALGVVLGVVLEHVAHAVGAEDGDAGLTGEAKRDGIAIARGPARKDAEEVVAEDHRVTEGAAARWHGRLARSSRAVAEGAEERAERGASVFEHAISEGAWVRAREACHERGRVARRSTRGPEGALSSGRVSSPVKRPVRRAWCAGSWARSLCNGATVQHGHAANSTFRLSSAGSGQQRTSSGRRISFPSKSTSVFTVASSSMNRSRSRRTSTR
jgi:hypothetical protein